MERGGLREGGTETNGGGRGREGGGEERKGEGGGEAATREGCSEAVCREEARINSHCRYRRLGQVMEHDGEFSSASGTHTALAGASLSLPCCVLSQRLACPTVLTEQKAGFALGGKSSSHELFIINDLVGILPLGGQPGRTGLQIFGRLLVIWIFPACLVTS